jgi:hypothetical protein
LAIGSRLSTLDFGCGLAAGDLTPRDDGVGILEIIFPTADELPGPDKDARVGQGTPYLATYSPVMSLMPATGSGSRPRTVKRPGKEA